MKPAFSKLEKNFYHAFDGRSKTFRVKLSEHEDGTITLAKFRANLNEKLRSVVLTIEEAKNFRELTSEEKARVVFKKFR